MFSDSIIWYLFFAGVGSGLSIIVFIIDSFLRRFRPGQFLALKAFIAPGQALGLVLVALGSVFLLFDLGRSERFVYLFLSPSPSIVTVGAWSLLVFMVLTLTQLALRLRLARKVPKPLHVALRWANMISAFLVMLYTGLLLQSFSTIHFFTTPLLPALFVFSSLTGGVALLELIVLLRQPDSVPAALLPHISKAHLPMLACEALLLAAYLFWAFQRSSTAAASAASLVSGDYLLIFWGGVVLCGMMLPLLIVSFSRGRATPSLLATHALSLLAGGLALRYCFLMVGMHPQMFLPSVM